ncbi:hypothetical protein COL32_11950 [Bacillus pseudomycoides]|nr:hypothetical protein BLX05_14310 [Bacillus pseudomycoides]PDY08753.1 hypothetical protein COO16_29100 [Bacillus pseudomycoides]PDZ13055.1 hypothetical protein CON70_02760 [Bacillus pseudomycoides]PEE03499.1 hypothetical protein CON86_25245 [Bacillus pseudomycoides]PEM66952.1 hypothetical protein CN632_26500 [Bacillus pseudomycoides]
MIKIKYVFLNICAVLFFFPPTSSLLYKIYTINVKLNKLDALKNFTLILGTILSESKCFKQMFV